MAMMLRDNNRLATLRCGMRLRSRRAMMATQPFLGAEALGPELLTPLAQMGPFPGAPKRGGTEEAAHGLPAEVLEQVDRLDAEAAAGAPLWLQVERDARLAAIYPWETHLAARTGRSVLRIPNYLANPWLPRRRVRLAICASAAQASDLTQPLDRLLTALAAARRKRMPDIEITLFTDAEAHPWLSGMAGKFARSAGLRITAPDPRQAPGLAEPHGSSAPSEEAPPNPWLEWMTRHHAATGIDAVQFLCAGFGSRDRSALALARSPLQPARRDWARVVEVDELAAFYDRLGCAIMGFTPHAAPGRADAIEALAYQLAWTRPGPIFVDAPRGDPGGLTALWRMLLLGGGRPEGFALTLPCYVHPALAIGATSGAEDMEAPDPAGRSALSYGAPAPGRALPDGLAPAILNLPEGRMAQLLSIGLSLARSWRDLRRPPAAGLTDRLLETQRAQLSSAAPRSALEQARVQGAKAALDFLDEVLKR